MWVAISRLIFFFEKSVTAVRRQKVLGEFINKLQPGELHNGYFPQDGSTVHTARMTLNYPRKFYDGLLMSSHLDHFHLPGSLFLITLDYCVLLSCSLL
jgi:hypothetical protein